MPARFWTEERLEDLRRFYARGWENKRIARYFDVTEGAVRVALSKYDVSSIESGAMRISRALTGKRKAYLHKQRVADAVRDRWLDPDYWRKMKPHLERLSTPENHERGATTRRGYSLTENERELRDRLRTKKLSAAEIREALGK